MTLDALTPASVHSLWSSPKCLNRLCLTVFSSLRSSLLLVHIFLPNFLLPVNFAFNMLWYSTPWTAPPFSNNPLCGGCQWSSSGPLPSHLCSPLLWFQRTRDTCNLYCVYGHLLKLKCKYSNISRYWLWRVGRGQEPWEWNEAGGVNYNKRHLRPSPATEELRKDKRRSDDSERRERTRPGFYFVFCLRQSSVRGCHFSFVFVYFIIKVFECSPVPASFFPI